MARNVEIKARIASVEAMVERVAAIADQGPFVIEQDDTFFACAAGRLKLRIVAPDEGELIFYRRADQSGPRESHYLRSPVPAPETLRALLTEAYGPIGRVRKLRFVYLVGRTRIHLDRVAGLGDFLEIEVVLRDAEPCGDAVREAHEILTQLRVEPSQLLDGAYVDLLGEQADS